MGTGYVSIILLAITLLIGPLNIYAKRLNPVSTDLRRDVGIWCGLTGLPHVVVGIQVHMGNIWLYFFRAVRGEDSYKFRDDLFGFTNYIGLLAGLLLVVLLLLSNNISIRWLKSKRWKSIQQWNYIVCYGGDAWHHVSDHRETNYIAHYSVFGDNASTSNRTNNGIFNSQKK